MDITKVFYRLLFSLSLCLLGLFALVWFSTYHPPALQQEAVYCGENTPRLTAGQTLKLYNQNVQFMAGKNYVFFYDLPNNTGPDERPSSDDITKTLKGLANLITQQNPDIILLQEVDEGAQRTDHADQLAQLLELLPSDYACHTSSFYWQAHYLPHPRIMGAVGTKLSIISKYKITTATRTQLSLIPQDPITQLFNLKRALQEVHLPIEGADKLVLLNTHLSAFSKGTDTLERQVTQINQRLHSLNKTQTPWVLAGDFNLLPPNAYPLLAQEQRLNYDQQSAIETLYQQHLAVPSLANTQSEQRKAWFTYAPNSSSSRDPDRTIDYYFYSPNLSVQNAFVEQAQSLTLSDHMPVIASFTLP